MRPNTKLQIWDDFLLLQLAYAYTTVVSFWVLGLVSLLLAGSFQRKKPPLFSCGLAGAIYLLASLLIAGHLCNFKVAEALLYTLLFVFLEGFFLIILGLLNISGRAVVQRLSRKDIPTTSHFVIKLGLFFSYRLLFLVVRQLIFNYYRQQKITTFPARREYVPELFTLTVSTLVAGMLDVFPTRYNPVVRLFASSS